MTFGFMLVFGGMVTVRAPMRRVWGDGLVRFGRLGTGGKRRRVSYCLGWLEGGWGMGDGTYEYGAAAEEVGVDFCVVPFVLVGWRELEYFSGYPFLYFWVGCEESCAECESVGGCVVAGKIYGRQSWSKILLFLW